MIKLKKYPLITAVILSHMHIHKLVLGIWFYPSVCLSQPLRFWQRDI